VRWKLVSITASLSLLLCIAVVVLWVLSYRGVGSIVWTWHDVRYELNSGRGRLIATRFHPWPKQPWFVEFEPGQVDVSPGIGWSGIRHHRGGFEYTSGQYLPPFSWQIPRTNYRRVGVPQWFIALLTAVAPTLFTVRFLRRRRAKPGLCSR